jgi:hypothetical protein
MSDRTYVWMQMTISNQSEFAEDPLYSNIFGVGKGVTAPPPPQWARTNSLTRFLDHTQTHHSRQDPSGGTINPSQRPLPDNTLHSQQTDIHASVGFEPTMSARERQQTCALDRAATGTGKTYAYISYFPSCSLWAVRLSATDSIGIENTSESI